MQYAIIETNQRKGLVALEPTNFGKSFNKLDSQTDESGWEEWVLYSSDGFDNEFAKADEARYAQRGWWGVNFRDRIVPADNAVDEKGRLHATYVSHAGLEWQKRYDVQIPAKGWYVKTDDGIFVPGTLVPFETLKNKKEAVQRNEARGIPAEQTSYLWRPNRYDSERIVGRDCGPGVGSSGRFSVYLGWLPSGSGSVRVGSRPAYKKRFWRRKPEIIMSVAANSKPTK